MSRPLGGSVVNSGAVTRGMILGRIRAAGRISRVELARASGLTQAAISTIVRQGIADGLVVEVGQAESTGGKRRTLLELNVTARLGLGVLLDRERMILVACDLSGRLIGRVNAAGSVDRDPEVVVRSIADGLNLLIESCGIDRSVIAGVGVAGPGPLDSDAGVLLADSPTEQWRGFPLRDRLGALTALPVVVDHDATCAAVGEFWTSGGESMPPVSATVYMADGIGCGILVDGRAFHGSSSNTGTLGHVTVDIDGPPCACGSRGCVVLYAAPEAVVRQALADPGLSAALDLTGHPGSTRDEFARIVRAAAQGGAATGHDAALQLVRTAARHLGQAIVTLVNLLDPAEVSLSGPGFADGGAIFAEQISSLLAQRAYLRGIHPVSVRVSAFGTEAAALGAAALVLQADVAPQRRRPVTG